MAMGQSCSAFEYFIAFKLIRVDSIFAMMMKVDQAQRNEIKKKKINLAAMEYNNNSWNVLFLEIYTASSIRHPASIQCQNHPH